MPPPVEIPTHVSVGVITSFTGLPERTVRQWAVEGKVPKSEPGLGYPFLDTVTAIRELLIAKLTPTDLQADKAAIVKADRETAEIEAGKARGELIDKPTGQNCWVDGMLKVKDCIQRASYIPHNERVRLIGDIQKLDIGNLDFDA